MNKIYLMIIFIVAVQLLFPVTFLYGRDLQDSKSVLQYIISTTRETIFSMGKEMSNSPQMSRETFFQPENIAGMCELAEAVIIFICDDLGLPRSAITRFQGDGTLGNKAVRHASIILTLPDGKTYLIDPTFPQFLITGKTKAHQIGYPGVLLRKTIAGQRLASRLTSDGYIVFDDEVANMYGKALSRNMQAKKYDVQFFIDNHEGDFKLTRFILGRHTWDSPPEYLVYH